MREVGNTERFLNVSVNAKKAELYERTRLWPFCSATIPL